MQALNDSRAVVERVAEILDDERRDQVLSQKELGAMAGISQSQLSKYLRVEMVMNLQQFVSLCNALGLTAGDVLAQATVEPDPH